MLLLCINISAEGMELVRYEHIFFWHWNISRNIFQSTAALNLLHNQKTL